MAMQSAVAADAYAAADDSPLTSSHEVEENDCRMILAIGATADANATAAADSPADVVSLATSLSALTNLFITSMFCSCCSRSSDRSDSIRSFAKQALHGVS